MDAALTELLFDRPVPALGGLSPSLFASEVRFWRPTTARWSNGEWMGGEREPDLPYVGGMIRIDDEAVSAFRDRWEATSRVPPYPILVSDDASVWRRFLAVPLTPDDSLRLPDDFDDEITAAAAQAGEERRRAIDWGDIPNWRDAPDEGDGPGRKIALGIVAGLGAVGLLWLAIQLLGRAWVAA